MYLVAYSMEAIRDSLMMQALGSLGARVLWEGVWMLSSSLAPTTPDDAGVAVHDIFQHVYDVVSAVDRWGRGLRGEERLVVGRVFQFEGSNSESPSQLYLPSWNTGAFLIAYHLPSLGKFAERRADISNHLSILGGASIREGVWTLPAQPPPVDEGDQGTRNSIASLSDYFKRTLQDQDRLVVADFLVGEGWSPLDQGFV